MARQASGGVRVTGVRHRPAGRARLRFVNYRPNPTMAQVLLSDPLKRELDKVAAKARALYVSKAPKRTGAMASGSKYGVTKSDIAAKDRWMGYVRVKAYYAVWNEMGAGPRRKPQPLPRHTGNEPFGGSKKGTFTFRKVISELKKV